MRKTWHTLTHVRVHVRAYAQGLTPLGRTRITVTTHVDVCMLYTILPLSDVADSHANVPGEGPVVSIAGGQASPAASAVVHRHRPPAPRVRILLAV